MDFGAHAAPMKHSVIPKKLQVRPRTRVQLILFALLGIYLIIAPTIELKYFLTQGKPVELPGSIPESEDLINSGVDGSKETVIEGEKLYKINGWSFLTVATDLADYDIYLVLRSEKRDYVFQTTPTGRRDIPRVFPEFNLDLKNSGFNVYIAKEALRVGDYQVCFLYINKETGQRYFQETDRHIIRTPNRLELVKIQ